MSADQEKYEVPEKVAKMSVTVDNMMKGTRKEEREEVEQKRAGDKRRKENLRSFPTLFSQPLQTSKTDIEKGDTIPLPNVSSKILSKIIAYCKFHSQHTEAKKAAEAATGAAAGSTSAAPAAAVSDDDVKDFDAEFVKVDQSALFELILAANYLNIKPLLDLTCLTVANMIKGKTPEEIRKTFNIPNDFTPEEEEEVRRENQWAFE